MTRVSDLALLWQDERPRLQRVAYAIVGSWSESEDVVSDCWERLMRADATATVHDVPAWATVTVARAALDVLRSARSRRETYVGPWLPEPIVEALDPAPDPADRVTLDDSVRYAMLVVLEQLSPAERTAFVLHDLFAMPFDEVALIVGRTAGAVRQLASRARRHVRESSARTQVDPAAHESTVTAFMAAAIGGDLDQLVALLDPSAVLTGDGGGVVSSARRPVVGANHVARFVLGIVSRSTDTAHPVLVNGSLGVEFRDGTKVTGVVALTVASARVQRIDIVRAPDKLPR